MLLAIKHDREPDWQAGFAEITRLNALPDGTEGKPEWDDDPEYRELDTHHLETFIAYWRSNLLTWQNLGGFNVLPHCEVSLQDPDSSDMERSIDRALYALDSYGVLDALGFEQPQDYRPNTTNRR